MKTILTLTLTALLSTACGNGSNTDKAAANAIDTWTAKPGSTAAPASTNGNTGGTAPTTGANAAPSLASFDVTPQGCVAQGAAQTFGLPNGLIHFVPATCAGSSQLYAVVTSTSGTLAQGVKLISDCQFGLEHFTADQGPQSFLAAYTCSSPVGAFDTLAREILPDLTIGESLEIRHVDGLASFRTFAPRIAWNASANAFGLAARGFFTRLDTTGNPVGGPTILDQEASIEDLTVTNGKWVALQHGGLGGESFSVINGFGIAQVNDQPIGLHPEGSNENDTTVFVGANLLGFGFHAQAWRTSPLSAQGASPAPALGQGKVSNALLAGAQIDAESALVLYRNQGSLLAVRLQTAGAQEIIQQIPIAGETNGRAFLRRIQNQSFLSWEKAGKAFVGILSDR